MDLTEIRSLLVVWAVTLASLALGFWFGRLTARTPDVTVNTPVAVQVPAQAVPQVDARSSITVPVPAVHVEVHRDAAAGQAAPVTSAPPAPPAKATPPPQAKAAPPVPEVLPVAQYHEPGPPVVVGPDPDGRLLPNPRKP